MNTLGLKKDLEQSKPNASFPLMAESEERASAFLFGESHCQNQAGLFFVGNP
jgi:hypothetical protein